MREVSSVGHKRAHQGKVHSGVSLLQSLLAHITVLFGQPPQCSPEIEQLLGKAEEFVTHHR